MQYYIVILTTKHNQRIALTLNWYRHVIAIIWCYAFVIICNVFLEFNISSCCIDIEVFYLP